MNSKITKLVSIINNVEDFNVEIQQLNESIDDNLDRMVLGSMHCCANIMSNQLKSMLTKTIRNARKSN